MRHMLVVTSTFLVILPSQAQSSFATVIRLALSNSPQVKIAEDDLRKARANLSEIKDAYVPSVLSSGGAGSSYGITLSVPTIFTISAQSLVFSSAQGSYIRSAKAGVAASGQTLIDTHQQVEEDAAVTYVALSHAQKISATLGEEYTLALKLTAIVEKRLSIGLETPLALEESRRNALQIELLKVEASNQVALLTEHLKQLTGLQGADLLVLPDTIPSIAPYQATDTLPAQTPPETPAVLSADAFAKARQERALGDSKYLWRPQVSFFGQYGRVSPINSVTDYYNIHGNYNAADIGVQVQVPFLDAAHKARAQQSLADASRSVHEASLLRSHQAEDQLRTRQALEPLSIKVELAKVDQKIAQEQLQSTLMRLKTGEYIGPPPTPKDEQNARLQERQRYAAVVDAELQLQKTQIFLLRQTGELETWIGSMISPAK